MTTPLKAHNKRSTKKINFSNERYTHIQQKIQNKCFIKSPLLQRSYKKNIQNFLQKKREFYTQIPFWIYHNKININTMYAFCRYDKIKPIKTERLQKRKNKPTTKTPIKINEKLKK